ncbi:MAG: MFS transporter [Oscillochloris sp.]|nr:MFS transporter [Oscillochloris sp.]
MAQLSRAARLYLLHMVLLTLGLSVNGLFFNLALVALGYDQRTLAIPLLGELSLLGLLNSLPVLAGALSSPLLWWLVSRVGLKVSLLISSALMVLPQLSLALWPQPVPLLLGSALGGPASALALVCTSPLLMQISGTQGRDLLFSLRFGLSLVVAGLGTLLSGFLPGLAARWLGLAPESAVTYQVAFGCSALVVLLALLPLLPLRLPDAAAESDHPGTADAGRVASAALRALARHPWGSLRLLIPPLLISCGASLLIPYLSVYFRLRYGASDAALGLIFAVIGVATGAAALLAPQFSARLGRPQSIVLSQGLAIPCLLLLGLAPTLWLATLLALVRGALMNMVNPLYEAQVMEHTVAEVRPIISGLLGAAYSTGYIVGPTLSAQIQRTSGFAPIFATTAACYALAVIANYLIFLRSPQPTPAS